MKKRYEEKIRVKPLTGKIAESVWNDADEKVKPKAKGIQHNILMTVKL